MRSGLATLPASALRVQRLPLADLSPGRPPLAALGYGASGPFGEMPGVTAPLLFGHAPLADVWCTDAPVHTGMTGAVRWRSDGQWLFGAIDLEESGDAGGLERLAQSAYRDLFETTRASGCTELQRIWNYLPRINDDGGGEERYRQFNVGRQQAFLDAGHSVFEGAPAACALGLPDRAGGRLCVRFLAGRVPPCPIENPRQVSAYRYPDRYGPRAPTFSRAALVALGNDEIALFISGTASIVGHRTVHEGDVAAQLAETLTNLRTVIAEANRRSSARFTLEDTAPVVYVRHAADAPRIRAQLAAALGASSRFMREAVFLQADICRSDLLVEIETWGSAPGSLAGS